MRGLRRFERLSWIWLGVCVGFSLYARAIPPTLVAAVLLVGAALALFVFAGRSRVGHGALR